METRTKLIIGGALALLLWLVLQVLASPPEVMLHGTQPRPLREGGAGRDLVVLVHGFGGHPAQLAGVHDVLAGLDAFADADLLAPEYEAGYLSNGNVFDVAAELELAIHEADEQHDYERIVLVGYSMGALLVRKAFVWAHGASDDRRASELGTQPWVGKVDRVVLLAGVNRGWSLDPRPNDMGVTAWVTSRALASAGRLFGFGRLVFGVERGEPFVANLRIQWMRAMNRLADPPIVVQLLGDTDDRVSAEDNRDVAVCAGFHFLPLLHTDHGSVLELGTPSSSRTSPEGRRRRALELALTAAPTELAAAARDGDVQDDDESMAERVQVHPDERIEHVIFVMHGIRDDGDWVNRLGDVIEEEAARRGEADRVEVVTSRYGRFPMALFLLGVSRGEKVRWFVDQYTEVSAKYPNARISFFGHSNGTYLATAAMDRYTELDFDTIVFAGSVVPSTSPWDERKDDGRFARFRNYAAASDLVVAVFPGVFEWLESMSLGFVNTDLGAGGFRGFQEDSGNEDEVRHVAGAHGAVVSKDGNGTYAHFPDIARYLLGDDVEVTATVDKDSLVDTLGNLALLVWLFLLVILAAPIWWLRRRAVAGRRVGGPVVAYLLVLVYLLLSV